MRGEKRMIYYENATDKQREYIRSMIRRRLGGCQSSLVSMLIDREDVDGFSTDDIEGMYPDPFAWDMDECREYLRDNGIDTPDPDPWRMTRDELIAILDVDDEPEERAKLEQMADGDLRRNIVGLMNNEYLGGLEDWREAVRQNAGAQEIYEWWPVEDSYLAEQLKEIGEPILDNNYGTWWGRTCTGQCIELDPTFWEVFQDALQRGYGD